MRRFLGTKMVIGAIWVGAVATLALACSDTDSPGSVIVAVSTDFALPKDVDQVGLFINADGKPVFSDVEPVVGGQVKFPATLAVTHNGSARPVLRVRAVAFSRGNVRVLRDALTTIPETRHVTLRMPLQFLADGSGTGPSPLGGGETPTAEGGTNADGGPSLASVSPSFEPFLDVVSTCPAQDGKLMTSVAGTCVPAEIDENALPEHDDAKVFGGAVAPESAELQAHGACFDAKTCFTTAFEVQPDADCTLPLPLGGTNIAVRTTGSAGECVGGACYVPLDYFPASSAGRGAGFWIEGGRAHLPAGLCAKMKSSAGAIGVAVGAGCNDRWKVESVPLCGPFSATDGTGALPTDAQVSEGERASIVGDGPSSIVDAGPDAADGDGGGAIGAPQLVAEALDPVDLQVNELGVFVAALEPAGRLASVAFTLDDKIADCNHTAAAPIALIVSGFPPNMSVRKIAVAPAITPNPATPVMMMGRTFDGTDSRVLATGVQFGTPAPDRITYAGPVEPLAEDITVISGLQNFGAVARFDVADAGPTATSLFFGATEIQAIINSNPNNLRSISRRALPSGETFGVIDVGAMTPVLHLLGDGGSFAPFGANYVLNQSATKSRVTITPDGSTVVGSYERGGELYFFRVASALPASTLVESLPFSIQSDGDGNARGFDVDNTHLYFARQATTTPQANPGVYRLPLANLGQKPELVQVLPGDRLLNGVSVFNGTVFWTERPTQIGTAALGAVRCKKLVP